jgi:hypothetical protein
MRQSFPPGVKRPGCEAEHSPPASAVVKKTWFYIHPLPLTSSWRNASLVKRREIYLFTLALDTFMTHSVYY